VETFGRYELITRLAAGGMGEIYFARSASLDGFEKDLVIKRILPELTADPQFVSMFIDEARISISLSHQNVVQVFDFGEAEGSYYLAMEYVDGCDLEQLLEVDGALSPGLAFFIMAEACKGLEYTHNVTGRDGEPLGLVHRDVSPGNILVSFEGGVKVTDFGIAESQAQSESTDGGPVGKLHYMAPEQAAGEGTDRRSDVFACGIVLWELLVGRRAYEGERHELLGRIAVGAIDPPSKHNPKITQAIDDIVMKALAPEPADRYPTAREFGLVMQDVLRQYRDFDSYGLAKHLSEVRDRLDRQDIERPPPRRTMTPSIGAHDEAEEEGELPPALVAQARAFREKPNLWRFVHMGDAAVEAGQKRSAVACYRVAAVKFAQAGLLAETLLCGRRMLAQRDDDAVVRDLGAMVSLVGRSDPPVVPHLFRGSGPAEECLSQLLFRNPLSVSGVRPERATFLSSLGKQAFGLLARHAEVLSFGPEDLIVGQGDPGESMYLVLSGRTLVYITNEEGMRVYLASLTSGQFFGENSFFTGSPRTASVEAIEPVELVEIDRALYDTVMADNPGADEILAGLYRTRVVDAILAKSQTFGLLDTRQRRAVIDLFELRQFEAGEVMIKQGAKTDEIFLIKTGTAEVYVEEAGSRRFIAEIEADRIIGEIAALQGVPRTATVIATSAVEALALDGTEFIDMLATSSEVAEKVYEVINTRASLKPPPLRRGQTDTLSD